MIIIYYSIFLEIVSCNICKSRVVDNLKFTICLILHILTTLLFIGFLTIEGEKRKV